MAFKNWFSRVGNAHHAVANEAVAFRCNVCGEPAHCELAELGRENSSCVSCGSTVRMRAMVHLISMAVFGRSIALPDFPHRPDLAGVGLSDWDGYAKGLGRQLDYTNTYYHQEPFLDITAVPDHKIGTCDFVCATDVFEHVTPPVNKAFVGARRLLKPGGSLVMSVPFMIEEDETREHFPELHEFEIKRLGRDGYRLVNRTTDGRIQEFDNLIFHGGPGSTLEMRLFARQALLDQCEQAGFTNVRFAAESVPEFGIVWQHPWSVPLVAQAPSH